MDQTNTYYCPCRLMTLWMIPTTLRSCIPPDNIFKYTVAKVASKKLVPQYRRSPIYLCFERVLGELIN